MEEGKKEKGYKKHLKDKGLKNIIEPTKSIIEGVDFFVDDYTPANFNTLIFFFSSNDWVVKAGAINKWTAAASVAVPVAITAGTYGLMAINPAYAYLKIAKDTQTIINGVASGIAAGKTLGDSASHLAQKISKANFLN